MTVAGVSLPVGMTSWGSGLPVHNIKLDASASNNGSGWWEVGPSSHPSSERVAVSPPWRLPQGGSTSTAMSSDLQPRQSVVGHLRTDLTLHSSVRSPTTCGGVSDLAMCGGSAPSRWRVAFLRGLTGPLSWGGCARCGSARGALLRWVLDVWPLPRQGGSFLFEDLVNDILVVGASVLEVVRWFWWAPTVVVCLGAALLLALRLMSRLVVMVVVVSL
jgi:hypothetical protein